jgi:gas vesicle structural protein
MAVAYERIPAQRSPVQKMGGSASLAELLGVILDKGIVIDAWVRVSVIGIEILTIEARVVVASVETYLRYAEAIGLTQLASPPPSQQGSRQGGTAQQNGSRSGGSALSDDQIAGYLEDHPDGVRLGEMQAYFDAPREDLQEILDQLVEERRVRQDEKRKVYYPDDNES